MLLLVLSVQLARLSNDIVEVATGEFAVRIVLGIFLHIHVDGTVGYIRVAFVQNLLHESNLLDNMSRSVRFDRRRQYIECCHVAMVAVGIELHYLHRLELLEARFLCYLVFTLIRIVLEVAHIGDVAHIAHLITEVLQIAIKDIESDGRTRMSQMGITVHGRTADIHAYVSFVQRREGLFESC